MNRRLAIIVILSAVAIELLLQGMVWRIEAARVDRKPRGNGRYPDHSQAAVAS